MKLVTNSKNQAKLNVKCDAIVNLTKKEWLAFGIITLLTYTIMVYAYTLPITYTDFNSQETANEFSQQALIPIAIVATLCLYSGAIKLTSRRDKLFSS